jgi:hypothetical protein
VKGRDHSEDLGVDGTVLSEGVLKEIGPEGVDGIRLV